MKTPISGAGAQQTNASAAEVEKKSVNSELWQACAGPLVNLPAGGTHVVYFPQGHSEQVAASLKKGVDAQIPNYPNLPSKLLCILHSVTLHADLETDEVYAQMTLQPVPSFDKDALLRSDLLMKAHKPQTEFFCKTLTASDTSTHGGFSVPRRAAEKIFPPLDFTMQPPVQELVARDLHDNLWTFRHIYRGQPKRHLLTTGWSLVVSGKRLFAGDSVLFIRDEKQELLLGVRRAHRQPTNLSSSVLSSDSMQIGILAAAAHAAANNSPFTVFYNPRTSSSEFVIPLAKYYKATCGNQISLGMRFRMMFETEESGTRRYMGTITGISDLDPARWKNSQWRNLQVGWDESNGGEKRSRVSIWEIEPVTAPFFICPTQPFFRSKRPRQPGMPDDDPSDPDNIFRRTMPWIGDDFGIKDPQVLPGFSLAQWMNMQQNPSSLPNPMQPNYMSPLSGSDISRQLGLSAMQMATQQNNIQFNTQMPPQQYNLQFSSQKLPTSSLGSIGQPQQHITDISQPRQNSIGQSQTLPSQSLFQQPQSLVNHQQLQRNHSQQQILMPSDQTGPQSHISENHIQMQLLQKLHQQQLTQQQDHQKQMTRNYSQNNLLRFPQPPHQHHVDPNINHPINNNSNNQLSAVNNDVPSCSTSPSTGNCSNEVAIQSPSPLLNPRSLEATAMPNPSSNLVSDVKHSMNVFRSQNQGLLSSQPYIYNNNANGTHAEYLDSSSSATSVLSQNDVRIHPPSNNSMSLNSQSMLFRDASHDVEVQGDPRAGIPFGGSNNNMGVGPLGINENVVGTGKDLPADLSSGGGGGVLPGYENHNEAQGELSSSMISQSFGVPDMVFNSIDSTINDDEFMNRGAWAPPQLPRMRTYTKVYKRGAVGRSIDIGRYSGYDELKQDLARRFGIEGQLVDRQRVGWKLVYVDNENDVLLVGDDPWEEFVSCVRCIKIVSPQEVQQLSLDGDFGNSVLPHQACSSSDNGVN